MENTDTLAHKYWLRKDVNYSDPIHLFKIKESIKDFTSIITGKNINVVYAGTTSYTDGTSITISSDFKTPKDIDVMCGLVLHEAAHIRLTPFDQYRKQDYRNWIINHSNKYPSVSYQDFEHEIHTIFNFVEDRRIDRWVQQNYPGFIDYYIALYDKYFYNANINENVIINEILTNPTFSGYVNAMLATLKTNNESPLYKEIPNLEKIMGVIDIPNILRLWDVDMMFHVCFTVYNLILEAIKKIAQENKEEQNTKENTESNTEQERSSNNIGGSSEQDNEQDGDPMSSEEIQDIFDSIAEAIQKIPTEEFKPSHSVETGRILSVLDNKHVKMFDNKNILVRWMPIREFMKFKLSASFCGSVVTSNLEQITTGYKNAHRFSLKFLDRSNESPLTFVRQESGKFDNRLIHEFGYTQTGRLLKQEHISNIVPLTIHVAIDVSGSMTKDNRWKETLKTIGMLLRVGYTVESTVVKIWCKTIVDDNSAVRLDNYKDKSTVASVAVVDTSKDSLSEACEKLSSIYPFDDETPEGHTIDMISNEIVSENNSGVSMFVNITDGEPNGIYVDEHFQLMCDVLKKVPETVFVCISPNKNARSSVGQWYPSSHVEEIKSAEELVVIHKYVEKYLASLE